MHVSTGAKVIAGVCSFPSRAIQKLYGFLLDFDFRRDKVHHIMSLQKTSREPSMLFTRLLSLCFISLLFLSPSIAPASAQQPDSVDKLITLMKEAADEAGRACGKEIDDFCERVTPGEGRVVSCVMAFEDQLSDGCRLALFDIATLIGSTETFFEYAAEVCEPDIESLCGDVDAGGGRIASCMLEQKASASPQCQEAIDAFEGKLQ